MVIAQDGYFALETAHTAYLFRADETGNLRHLYYGQRIGIEKGNLTECLDALTPDALNPNGCSVIADEGQRTLCLDDVCLELSSRGKGDMREPFVELLLSDGSRTSDFRYESFRIERTLSAPYGLAGAYDDTGRAQSLIVRLADQNSAVKLELVYGVLEECDCITRYARIINEGTEQVRLLRLMSAQVDMDTGVYKLTSFHGDWTREMAREDFVLRAGVYVSEAVGGFSSNRTNPLFLWAKTDTSEEYGDCYGMNLVYSGNHRETAEMGGHGKMRVLTGLHPDFFSWRLGAGESFCSPEAVLTYSHEGYGGVSANFHAMIREHIVRGEWKYRQRPVLINSWEAMYMNVNERKLLQLAKAAREVGIELFVLDDGWFGKRDSDAVSLGDWQDNTEKLPHGLGGLSDKIHALGMQFGIWVEPEMISEASELYQTHPDWAVRIPGKAHALGRNQMVLDLTRAEVREYITESMSDVFARGKVDYVKWDMNRNLSDYYSQALSAQDQGEFAHRYILGLYEILETLTAHFPQILFEGCASGGNRFDLGMLCYMPQIWASDNTDAVSRARIQDGYSYGYPQSVITAHVSGCPNHQTLRMTPLAARFAIASIGILGYECNLCDADRGMLAEIREQISLYKKWREVLQFGRWYRLYGESERESVYDTEIVKWNVTAQDQSGAVGVVLQGENLANYAHHFFRAKGLDEKKRYHFTNRTLRYDVRCMGSLINTMAPVHVKQDSLVHDVIARFVRLDGEKEDRILSGAILNRCRLPLADSYAGTGFSANTALYRDFDARMYFMEEVQPPTDPAQPPL